MRLDKDSITSNYTYCLTLVLLREWSRGDVKTEEGQINRMNIFTNQTEMASVNNKDEEMMGDANLCIEKWDNKDFLPYVIW